jgi:ABC-type lipoprotein release transport system permease subunit
VAIVNEAFVRRYFGGGPALGRRIGEGGPGGTARYTIVGVTPDSKVANVRETALPFWYIPIAQFSGFDQLTLHVRATSAPEAALDDVRTAVAAIDKQVPVLEAATMREQIEDQLQVERLMAVLANVFAGLAVLLAWLGLYGVMSYVTSARSREVGVRMALGASPRAILGLMFRQSAFVIVAGVLGGVLVSYLTTGQMQSLLFELEPTDPMTIITATAIAVVVTTMAALLPARRAARLSPVQTLR